MQRQNNFYTLAFRVSAVTLALHPIHQLRYLEIPLSIAYVHHLLKHALLELLRYLEIPLSIAYVHNLYEHRGFN